MPDGTGFIPVQFHRKWSRDAGKSCQWKLIFKDLGTFPRRQWVNTLRPRQMVAISQTTLSIAFSWMKMLEFRLRFHWNLFPSFQLTIFQHWFRYWLGAVQVTSHYLNQWWLVYWRIYASLGLNELTNYGVMIPYGVIYLGYYLLSSLITTQSTWTHWGWDKMAAVIQMTFSNAFSWMEGINCMNFD